MFDLDQTKPSIFQTFCANTHSKNTEQTYAES